MLKPFKHLFRTIRPLAVVAAFTLAASITTPPAFADKVHLKDGRVLEGRIVREGDGFIFLKIKVGSLEQDQMITSDQIASIDRDTPKVDDLKAEEPKAGDEAKPTPASGTENKGAKGDLPSTKADKFNPTKKDLTGATRVAVLNFGPPSSWQGSVESTVGIEISAEAFRRVIPMLEKAKADVVVIRINSGGGLSLEMERFQDLFQQEYKPRFRTVAWIESAISAAAMSPWVIEEYYFFTQGSMGACTEFSGRLNASKGGRLEMVLARMEHASELGKKPICIMRAMEIQEPLSVDVDEAGNVTWRQDEAGKFLLNPKGQVFTINSREAVKFKFALGLADTKEELAKAMGLSEVEWVALDAGDAIDKNMRENDKAEKRFQETRIKYEDAVKRAESAQDKQLRATQIQLARKYLEEMRRAAKLNPNYSLMHGTDEPWFEEQDDLLLKLAKRP